MSFPPNAIPKFPTLKMKLENLLLLNLSKVSILPPWPPEIKKGPFCGSSQPHFNWATQTVSFSGYFLLSPSSSTLPQHWLWNTLSSQGDERVFLQKAWRNHHQQKRIGPCQAKSRCGKAMVRAGGTLALVLLVLCWQQGLQVLSVAQLAPENDQILESGYL